METRVKLPPKMCTEERLDMELFIEEIKKYPEIWNVFHEDYKDKDKKLTAWRNISRIFTEDFDLRIEAEKKEIGRKYMNKWKNIKDNYVRVRKKEKLGRGLLFGRKYIYAKNLSFLETVLPSVTTGSATDEEQNEVNVVNYRNILNDAAVSAAIKGEETPQPLLKGKESPVKRRKELQRNSLEFKNTPNIPTTPSTPSVVSCSVHELDEDRAFFESLLPTIRLFNVDQKLEFRSDILNTIKRIRMTSTTSE